VHESLSEAVADCNFVLACTARQHDQAKPVVGADAAAAEMAPRVAVGEKVALVFGRERYGLEMHEVGLADRIITLPVNPAFASLNLAQAVVILGYEWFKASGGALPFSRVEKSPPAPREQLAAFFRDLERELDRVEFFRPAEKRETMLVNLRNIFLRIAPTEQDIRTLYGVVMMLAQGRKGPARGGVLDAEEAQRLREVIAEHGADKQTPARGLAKLLRRNPTEAERVLWQALTNDRRFAGRDFRRQVPVGAYIVDFVSFPMRCVIDLVPPSESEEAARTRAEKREWLAEHDYRVVAVNAADVERDLATTLAQLADAVGPGDAMASKS
jgi:tRNA/rRNA methyltransferase